MSSPPPPRFFSGNWSPQNFGRTAGRPYRGDTNKDVQVCTCCRLSGAAGISLATLKTVHRLRTAWNQPHHQGHPFKIYLVDIRRKRREPIQRIFIENDFTSRYQLQSYKPKKHCHETKSLKSLRSMQPAPHQVRWAKPLRTLRR